MACHEVGPRCTVIGADDGFGGMWMAWAGAAVMGSPFVGVIAASPWMVRRRLWRSFGSAHALMGSLIEWTWMAWSPGVISSHPSVLLWTAHCRGRFRNPLRSGVVWCWWGSFILVMGWASGSWWGRSCAVDRGGVWGISSSGCCGAFASYSSALMMAKTSWRVGEAGGCSAGWFQVRWYPAAFSGSCCMMMAVVASFSGVHRCGMCWRGWRVMVWWCLQL